MNDYSPTGFWAYFKRDEPEGDKPFHIIPVQRFTDTGEALVFNRSIDQKKLVPASIVHGYEGLRQEDLTQTGGRKLIGAITAQPGWFLKSGDSDGGVTRVEGWGVLENGELIPIDDRIWDEEGNRLHMHWIDQDLTKEKPYYTLHRVADGYPPAAAEG